MKSFNEWMEEKQLGYQNTRAVKQMLLDTYALIKNGPPQTVVGRSDFVNAAKRVENEYDYMINNGYKPDEEEQKILSKLTQTAEMLEDDHYDDPENDYGYGME